MYRDFSSMVEGWTKNLALLFLHPLRLAFIRSMEFAVILASLALGLVGWARGEHAWAILALVIAGFFYLVFLRRILRAHFPLVANLLSFLGLPLFAGLLVRSWRHSRAGSAVTWKGRTYTHSVTEGPGNSSINRSRLES